MTRSVSRGSPSCTEGHDRGLHARGGCLGGEQVEHAGAELVDVQVGGVDDDVGLGLHRAEQLALRLDGVGQGEIGGGERVTPPAALVAAHQGVGGGLQVDDAHPSALAAERLEGGQHLVVVGAGADHEDDLGDAGAGRLSQLRHLGHERRREVVDDEPAQVLEDVRRLRAAGTGQPGDDHEVAHGRTLPAPTRTRPGDVV